MSRRNLWILSLIVVVAVSVGAGAHELWVHAALRDRPWHLEFYLDSLVAECRTAPGAYAFSDQMRVLDGLVATTDQHLAQKEGSWALLRDYAPCVNELLSASLAAQHLKLCETARFHDERDRLEVLLRTLDEDLNPGAGGARRAPKLEVTNFSQSRARILLAQARSLRANGQVESALEAALRASVAWRQGEDSKTAELARFYDPQERLAWDRQARELLNWTKRSGRPAMLVDKMEHRCLLLAGGRVEKSYTANLGRRWYRMKLQEHDASTPEGEYRIKRKFRSGSFGWALLLDYPNDNDRRRFSAMKREGLLPPNARIGGNIEIHGHGRFNSDWTDGCMSLVDGDMADLYRYAYSGMPVTIVGTSRLTLEARE